MGRQGWSGMRGTDERAGALFSYVDLEARVPAGHPLRAIREIVNQALGELSPTFDRLYAPLGRPSIPPEQLLRALLLQAFYSIRSERQLMERLDFDLLFRWFVGPRHRRSGVGPLDLLEEPRPAARGDVAAGFLADGARPAQGAPPVVERALQRRRHADPGVGVDEELPAQRRCGRAAGRRRPQRQPRLSRRAQAQRYPRLDHRR